ncbi:NUDIX domain-containing protein [Chloroflexota bacterium]
MPVPDQGHTFDRYTLIPRTLIFLTRKDRILLIKGAPHKRLWADQYNGIGGHVESGEDLLTAARRELLEETGLSPVDLWLCGTITIDTGENPGIGIFVYRGEGPDKELKESPEGALEWVSLDHVFDLPLVEDLHTLLPKVLEVERETAPFSALYTYLENDQLLISFGK